MKQFLSPLFAAALALLAALAAPLAADDSALLTVTIGEQSVTYSAEDLAGLGPVGFTTATIWTDGPQAFTGVSLHRLMEDLGVESGVLLASAVNDYTVEIPVSDATPDGPIVAFERNGERMSLRDKGPLWIVYPYDNNPVYQSEVIYSRSIWQLDRIEVQG